jgi:hypothetical protein
MTKEYRGEDESEAPDAKGAVESEVERIEVIQGDEVLGYPGAGREEHSGEDADSSESGLADNEDAPDPESRG